MKTKKCALIAVFTPLFLLVASPALASSKLQPFLGKWYGTNCSLNDTKGSNDTWSFKGISLLADSKGAYIDVGFDQKAQVLRLRELKFPFEKISRMKYVGQGKTTEKTTDCGSGSSVICDSSLVVVDSHVSGRKITYDISYKQKIGPIVTTSETFKYRLQLNKEMNALIIQSSEKWNDGRLISTCVLKR